jgi:hypothetical protein
MLCVASRHEEVRRMVKNKESDLMTKTTTLLEPGTIFISNNGAGPLLAIITSVESDTVHLERWYPNKTRFPISFDLSIKYFLSNACGWRMQQ